MKKLIHILILMAVTCFASAQGMYRLGEGNELNMVQLVIPSGDEVLVFEVTESSEYELHSYNGITFRSLGLIPDIPLHGVEAQEDFRIVDALVRNGNVYVLGHDFGPNVSSSPNRVIEWDGNNWTDITSTLVKNASNVAKLISHNNYLTIVGIFNESGMVSFIDNNWSKVGGLLGSDAQMDYVLDVQEYLGKIYATGEFNQSNIGQPFNTAVYQNNEWKPLETPPFIGKSKHFEIINNELLLTGESNIIYDYIKSFNGIQWTDISAGLEDVTILEFWDIAGHGDLICITGSFEHRISGRQFNFIIKDKDGWHFGENDFQIEPIKLVKNSNQIYAYGKFQYGGINNIAEVTYHSAMISGKVYQDENNNCVFDASENGLELVKVTVNPGNVIGFTNKYGNYDIPVDVGNYSVTFTKNTSQEYGCGRLAAVNVLQSKNYAVPELNVIEKPNVVDLELGSTMVNGWKLIRNSYNEIKLIARNKGTENIKGASLSMKMGDWWKDVRITPEPTSSIDGELIWKITDLEKGETFEIFISGETKEELEQYNDFCFTGEVDLPQIDLYNNSNRETGELETVDDLDPITKQVDCGEWFTTNTEYITYQIRFENEADEIVDKVTVIDTFDSDLITTSAIDYSNLGSTKDLQTRLIKVPGKREWRMVYKWTTKNANLAPAGSSDGKDVGNVILKFELHELSKAKGIELCNQAQVIYDNNEPIYTNTVCSKATNLIVDKPNVVNTSEVNFFPNPAHKEITIDNKSAEIRFVEIRTQTGQLIYSTQVHQVSKKNVDLQHWASGIYILHVQGYESQKLVVH